MLSKGGNKRLKDFLNHEESSEDQRQTKVYFLPQAEYYRKMLRFEAFDEPIQEEKLGDNETKQEENDDTLELLTEAINDGFRSAAVLIRESSATLEEMNFGKKFNESSQQALDRMQEFIYSPEVQSVASSVFSSFEFFCGKVNNFVNTEVTRLNELN